MEQVLREMRAWSRGRSQAGCISWGVFGTEVVSEASEVGRDKGTARAQPL